MRPPGGIAALAQPVEHVIRNDGVGCSSHPSGTTLHKFQQTPAFQLLRQLQKVSIVTLLSLRTVLPVHQDAPGLGLTINNPI
jgi:hypothetical protein